jgi:hypothetical protein
VKSFIRLLAVVTALLITAHRLPAPIQEIPESATPAPEQSAKPKPKRTIKPKVTSESSETSTKRQTSSTTPPNQPTPAQLRFAGTWNGIMNCGIVGNIEHTISIDASQSSMSVWQTNDPSVRVDGPAQSNGDTLTGNYGWNGVWSVTPYPDGQTAKVRFQAFLLDSSAIFRRQTSVGSTQTTAPTPAVNSQPSTIPTAKPVPNKPGFVYNPFDPNSKILLDVRGHASGKKVKDPSGRLFIVP